MSPAMDQRDDSRSSVAAVRVSSIGQMLPRVGHFYASTEPGECGVEKGCGGQVLLSWRSGGGLLCQSTGSRKGMFALVIASAFYEMQ